MAEPDVMIVPLLREMRADNNGLHAETAARLDIIERRLARIEEQQTSYRQALSADSLLSKLVAGEFEKRIEGLEPRIRVIETLERRVEELEAHK